MSIATLARRAGMTPNALSESLRAFNIGLFHTNMQALVESPHGSPRRREAACLARTFVRASQGAGHLLQGSVSRAHARVLPSLSIQVGPALH